MNEDARPPRPPSVARMLLFAVGLGLVAGAGLGAARAWLGPSPWVTATGLAAVFVVLSIVVLPAWSRVDEAVRTAHQWAWFWGGSAGLMAAVVLAPFVLDAPEALSTEATAAAAGGMGVILLQLVGYGVAWAIWWLRRR